MATRAEIAEMVKARIDELTPFETATELNPSLQLIDKLMDEATRIILLTFPKHSLPIAEFVNPSGWQEVGYDANLRANNAIGFVRVNSTSAPNWIRFHSFKMWEWKRVVFEAITVENPKYKLQSNDITMGKPSKPVVALVHTSEGELALEYYSCDPELQTHNHEIVRAMYVPDLKPEECNDRLLNAIAWSTAASVLQVLGEGELMKAALARVELIKQTI